MDTNPRVIFAWRLLRYAYGAVVFLAGLDKILGTDLIVNWPKYISPFVLSILPVSVGTFLLFMGIVEVIVAILLVTKFPRVGGYLTLVWLILISINLLMLGYIDIAIRDLLLAVGAVAMAEITVAVSPKHAWVPLVSSSAPKAAY